MGKLKSKQQSYLSLVCSEEYIRDATSDILTKRTLSIKGLFQTQTIALNLQKHILQRKLVLKILSFAGKRLKKILIDDATDIKKIRFRSVRKSGNRYSNSLFKFDTETHCVRVGASHEHVYRGLLSQKNLFI